MATFKFRSVGKTTQEQKIANDAIEPTPTIFGIKTPLRYGSKAIFAVTTSLDEQIGDNLKNLLQANHGERLILYDYGANLRPLVTEWSSQDDFDAQAVERIKTAISTYMPYVNPKQLISKIGNINTNGKVTSITLVVIYDVPQLKIVNKSVEVTLYVL